jgi:hypothetical protein
VVVSQLGAILVVAQYVSGIISQQVAIRTIIHGTSALLPSACVEIFYGARYILAQNVCCIITQNVSNWGDIIIAESSRMTTRVSISVHTLPTHTIFFKCIGTQNEAFRAMEGEAMIVFCATLIQICICALYIIAENIFSVHPVRVA